MPLHTEPDTYTSLLIHSDSVEGTQAFTDSSRHNHSISYTGAVHHDTQTSIGGGISVFGQSSMFFDGGSDYLSVPDHSAFDFGTGDFTIDFWLRLNSAGGNKNYISRRGVSNDTFWFFRTEGGPYYQFDWYEQGGSGSYSLLGGVPVVNVWHHIAITRCDRSVKMYEDGKIIDQHTETVPRDYDGGEEVYVGARYHSGVIQWLDGWLDEVRVSKGIARWNDSFVPPTKPYSVIDNDAIADISGLEDIGGNTGFSRDIVIKSDPGEASSDSLFSVSKKDGTSVLDLTAGGRMTTLEGSSISHYDTAVSVANDTWTTFLSPGTNPGLYIVFGYINGYAGQTWAASCTLRVTGYQTMGIDTYQTTYLKFRAVTDDTHPFLEVWHGAGSTFAIQRRVIRIY